MMDATLAQQQVLLFVMCLLAMVQPVKADLGDVIATFLALGIIFTCVCAGIGWWSRRPQ
jgi:hypothetical protein